MWTGPRLPESNRAIRRASRGARQLPKDKCEVLQCGTVEGELWGFSSRACQRGRSRGDARRTDQFEHRADGHTHPGRLPTFLRTPPPALYLNDRRPSFWIIFVNCRCCSAVLLHSTATVQLSQASVEAGCMHVRHRTADCIATALCMPPDREPVLLAVGCEPNRTRRVPRTWLSGQFRQRGAETARR